MKKMLIECVDAYLAANGLMEVEWDYPSAYALTRLRRALQPHADFFIQEENKLTRQYGQKDREGQVCFTQRGTFLFEDPAQAGEYNAKRQALGAVEVELDWEEKALPSPERIRPAQIEALEGFIRFSGEGEQEAAT